MVYVLLSQSPFQFTLNLLILSVGYLIFIYLLLVLSLTKITY